MSLMMIVFRFIHSTYDVIPTIRMYHICDYTDIWLFDANSTF